MSRKLYCPVEINNQIVSKQAMKGYFPLETGGQFLSKKIVKAYCSVNGLSKLFYADGGGTTSDYWNYYKTSAEPFLWTQLHDRTFSKSRSGIGYFCVIKAHQGGGVLYPDSYVPILVSTDPDGVCYGSEYTALGSFVVNGTTWYWNGWYLQVYGTLEPYPVGIRPDCLLSDSFYNNINTEYVIPAQDLVARVRSTCFAQNYQSGNTYNLPLADIEKTIRKGIGIFLHRFISIKSETCYSTLLQYADTFISELVADAGNDPIACLLVQYSSGWKRITLRLYRSSSSPNNKLLTNYETYGDYSYFMYSPALTWNGYNDIVLNQDGSITRSSGSGNADSWIGVRSTAVSVQICNMGLYL